MGCNPPSSREEALWAPEILRKPHISVGVPHGARGQLLCPSRAQDTRLAWEQATPEPGSISFVIRGAAHSPCPPNPRQMCWVWMRWGAAAFVSRRFPCKPREQRAWGEGVPAGKAAPTLTGTWHIFRKWRSEEKQLHKVLPRGLGLRGPSDLLLPFISTTFSLGPQFPCWM